MRSFFVGVVLVSVVFVSVVFVSVFFVSGIFISGFYFSINPIANLKPAVTNSTIPFGC